MANGRVKLIAIWDYRGVLVGALVTKWPVTRKWLLDHRAKPREIWTLGH